jgi:hypothetical protein
MRMPIGHHARHKSERNKQDKDKSIRLQWKLQGYFFRIALPEVPE